MGRLSPAFERRLVFAAAFAVTLAACQKKSEEAAPPAAAAPTALEGQLDIVAWPGYIERGETDKSYDWVTSSRRSPGARSTSRPPARRMKWCRS